MALVGRFLGAIARGRCCRRARPRADPKLVQQAETLLAGAIGSASARVMVASVVDEEALELGDVMRIVEEASELRQLNTQLQSLTG